MALVGVKGVVEHQWDTVVNKSIHRKCMGVALKLGSLV